jgi:hypothetical protein
MRAANKFILKLTVACAIFAGALELACSVYAARLRREWNEVRQKPDHYFQTSADPVLAYELKPDFSLFKDGRRLNINRFGIRDDSDAVPEGPRKIALLGDSVVFGTGFSQDETIAALLQQALDPATNRVRVLNFGVPGYNLPELAGQLNVKDAVYHVDEVIYVMNPNDFCRRNTMTEGADNGLYRMYCEPRIKSAWFLLKLAYRAHKGDPVSPSWYSWIFDRGADAGFRDLETIASHCASAGQRLTVVLLPAGCAYENGTYALTEMERDISSRLEQRGIAFIDTAAAFGESPQTLLNETDHLTLDGNRVMAGVIAAAMSAGR